MTAAERSATMIAMPSYTIHKPSDATYKYTAPPWLVDAWEDTHHGDDDITPLEIYVEDVAGWTEATPDDAAEILECFDDAFEGEWETLSEWCAENLTSAGYIPRDMPNWVEIDWEATALGDLGFDYTYVATKHGTYLVFRTV